MRKHYIESNAKNHCTHNKQRKTNWISYILYRNCLLQHFIAGKVKEWEYEENDLSSYWTTLRKDKDTGNGKRKQ
jgi:hypothetical protein